MGTCPWWPLGWVKGNVGRSLLLPPQTFASSRKDGVAALESSARGSTVTETGQRRTQRAQPGRFRKTGRSPLFSR